MVLACINCGTFIYLQSLGKALVSTMLSMLRELVFGVGFALVLPIWFGLDGVLYSMPVSDVLTFVISAVVIARTYRLLAEDAPAAHQARWSYGSFPCPCQASLFEIL